MSILLLITVVREYHFTKLHSTKMLKKLKLTKLGFFVTFLSLVAFRLEGEPSLAAPMHCSFIYSCTPQFLLNSTVRTFDEGKGTVFTGLPQKLQNQIPGLSRTFLGHFPGVFKVFFTGLQI